MTSFQEKLKEQYARVETFIDASTEVFPDENVIDAQMSDEGLCRTLTVLRGFEEEILCFFNAICVCYPMGPLGIPMNVPTENWDRLDLMIQRLACAQIIFIQELREVYGPYENIDVRKGFQVVVWDKRPVELPTYTYIEL